jgi:N-acetylglucosaminyldiphosphoundecaprenol N-acetyl-beta-D-mannosaminyltransferase
MPIDAVDMTTVVAHIEAAAAGATPFIISTPNLNFLVSCQSDPEFRESLLLSDLCPTDGMPIVWIAKILGIPIMGRIAGSDIFEALKAVRHATPPLKIFLFGGAEDVAATACQALNAGASGLTCVGSMCPGFGTLDEMSRDDIIDNVNASHADFLVAALGARKGQLWLQRNHRRLHIPVRAHLGATINFQAGTVKRAPSVLQVLGFEWLWRIKEEPHLWRRYWTDGLVLMRLLFTRILPLAVWMHWLRLRWGHKGYGLIVDHVQCDGSVVLALSGAATHEHVYQAVSGFREAVKTGKKVVINLSDICLVDARFLGLLLMVRKCLKEEGKDLKLVGLSPRLEKLFHLNGVGFLLSA